MNIRQRRLRRLESTNARRRAWLRQSLHKATLQVGLSFADALEEATRNAAAVATSFRELEQAICAVAGRARYFPAARIWPPR